MQPSRRSDIRPFMVMDLLDRANTYQAQGRDIVHMEVGQPGTAAPLAVRRAAQKAIEDNPVGYTETLGIPALRQRIARHYKESYGVDVSASRIAITAGSSAAFVLSFLAVFDTGARVALAAPYYPAYPNILKALGCDPLIIPTGPETHFQLSVDLAEQAIDAGCKGLLIASPANPTGSMIDANTLKDICALCAVRGVWLISDEIYHGITYSRQAETALAFNDDALIINSFSKYFSMTGWRIGWLVLPDHLLRTIERLNQNLFISTHAVSQLAALAAFDCADELDGHVTVYGRNRDLLLRELPQIGIEHIAPSDGAFYVYADVSHLTDNAEAFCHRMLDKIGVAATPGVDFDSGDRALRVRFSYAGTTQSVIEGIRRLRDWLPQLKR